MNEEKKRLNKV